MSWDPSLKSSECVPSGFLEDSSMQDVGPDKVQLVAVEAMKDSGSGQDKSDSPTDLPFHSFQVRDISPGATTTSPESVASSFARSSSSMSTPSPSNPLGSPSMNHFSSTLGGLATRKPLVLSTDKSTDKKVSPQPNPLRLSLVLDEEELPEVTPFGGLSLQLDEELPQSNPFGPPSLQLEDEHHEEVKGKALSLDAEFPKGELSLFTMAEESPSPMMVTTMLDDPSYVPEKKVLGHDLCSLYFGGAHTVDLFLNALEQNGHKLERPLGKGASGSAFVTETGNEVVKIFNVHGLHEQRRMAPVILVGADLQRSEYLAMCGIRNHSNLALPVGVYVYNTQSKEIEWIPREQGRARIKKHHILHAQVSPTIVGTPLSDILQKGTLPMHVVRHYAMQLENIMELLQEQGVLHRDLNPSNIIVTPEGRLVVIDWGTSINYKAHDPTSPVGAVSYRAPETFIDEVYGPSSDTFTLGALIYRMSLPELRAVDRWDAIKYNPKADPQIKGLKPGPLKSLLMDSLEPDPDKRIPLTKTVAYIDQL